MMAKHEHKDESTPEEEPVPEESTPEEEPDAEAIDHFTHAAPEGERPADATEYEQGEVGEQVQE